MDLPLVFYKGLRTARGLRKRSGGPFLLSGPQLV